MGYNGAPILTWIWRVGLSILTCRHRTAKSSLKCELILTSVLKTNYEHIQPRADAYMRYLHGVVN